MWSRALLVALGLTLWSRCQAAWKHGQIQVPANNAVFVAKFCFDFDVNANNTGELDFVINRVLPGNVGHLKVLLLDDQQNSYPSTNNKWPGMQCDDSRLSIISKASLDVEVDKLPVDNRLHTFIIERLRPRYWFLAVLDCSGVEQTVEYDLHMVNLEQGWMKEISMDRCGLFPLALFLGIYLSTALLQVHAIFSNSSAQTKHPLRLLLTFGICAALWGVAFYTFDTIWYAVSGEDTFLLYVSSKLFKVWSKFTLMLILILLSRGKCISSTLELEDIVKGAILVMPFLVLCLSLELWGEYDASRNYTTEGVYQTGSGAVLIFADMILLLYYVNNLRISHRAEKDEEKRAFYRTWGTVYSSAFLSLPAAAIVAHEVSPHVRVAVMLVFNNSIHAALLILLVAGLWPERTQPVFNIDNKAVDATAFGRSGNLLDEEMKSRTSGGDYAQFADQEALCNGNG